MHMLITNPVIAQYYPAYPKFGGVLINSTDAAGGTFWFCGVNIMPADAVAPKVARASASMILAL